MPPALLDNPPSASKTPVCAIARVTAIPRIRGELSLIQAIGRI
jgi:hypothetical protein